mgnify:CR=1 FL=1
MRRRFSNARILHVLDSHANTSLRSRNVPRLFYSDLDFSPTRKERSSQQATEHRGIKTSIQQHVADYNLIVQKLCVNADLTMEPFSTTKPRILLCLPYPCEPTIMIDGHILRLHIAKLNQAMRSPGPFTSCPPSSTRGASTSKASLPYTIFPAASSLC